MLPQELTLIGHSAFKNSGVYTGSLVIPDKVTMVRGSAFSRAGFNGPLTLGKSLTRIESYAFEYCGFTGPLVLPPDLTIIGDQAFYVCSGFTGPLTIPDKVTDIGSQAFYPCTGLSGKLTLGKSVTYIGQMAFMGTGFSTAELPASVVSMGYGCIECRHLTDLYSRVADPNAVTYFNNPFYGDQSPVTLHVPKGKSALYSNAQYWKDFGSFVEMDDVPEVRGDLTGEGTVDVDDMNLLINMMLHKAEPTQAADINGDGAVDVDDMNIIINIMIHKE